MRYAFALMTAMIFLLRRYLLPREGNFLAFALWISVAGVALGIIQLMVVLSVMSGFQEFLKDSHSRITSEMVVLPRRHESLSAAPESSSRPVEAILAKVPEIQATTPFALGQAMVIKEGVGGAVLEGIDFERSKQVTPWMEIWTQPPWAEGQKYYRYWIWLGAQLAKKLGAKVGDHVNIFIPGKRKKVQPFTVTAITKFGIFDHDLRYAYVDLAVMNELFNPDPIEPMYKVKLAPGASLEATAKKVTELVDDKARVKLWSEVSQNTFLAVQHQKYLLFLILQIIVALAAINVVNLLMMSSHQRRRDIAILRTMGMQFRSIFFFFVAQGAAVGSVGISLGVGFGYLVCLAVERFQPAILSESVYNVTRLPIRIEFRDVSLICVAALILCIVFSVLPALVAASSPPVKALRYE